MQLGVFLVLSGWLGYVIRTPMPCKYKCKIFLGIRLSEVYRKIGAELLSNGIVRRSLEIKQKVSSQVPPHNAIVDEFGTSLLLNLGKAN